MIGEGIKAGRLEESREPRELAQAVRTLMEGPQRYFTEYPDWQRRIATHREERLALHETLQAVQATVARLRLVLVVLPPFDTPQDWAEVERAARNLDDRLGGVEV